MPACYGNEEGDQRSLWTSQLIPDISLFFSFPGRSSNGTCGERWVVNPCHYHHHHHQHLSWASVSERLTQWPRPDVPLRQPNERGFARPWAAVMHLIRQTYRRTVQLCLPLTCTLNREPMTSQNPHAISFQSKSAGLVFVISHVLILTQSKFHCGLS